MNFDISDEMRAKYKGQLSADFFSREKLEEVWRVSSASTLNVSIFLAAYAEYEGFLASVADDLFFASGSPFNIKDIRHTGIEKSKLIIDRLAIEGEFFKSSEWRKIQQLRELRNCYLHSAGVVEEPIPNQKLNSAIASVNHVDIRNDFGDGRARLVFGMKFAHSSITTFKAAIEAFDMWELEYE